MKPFEIDLLEDEIQTAEKLARKYLEYIVDDICIGGQELKEDQVKIIWASLETFANQCVVGDQQ